MRQIDSRKNDYDDDPEHQQQSANHCRAATHGSIDSTARSLVAEKHAAHVAGHPRRRREHRR